MGWFNRHFLEWLKQTCMDRNMEFLNLVSFFFGPDSPRENKKRGGRNRIDNTFPLYDPKADLITILFKQIVCESCPVVNRKQIVTFHIKEENRKKWGGGNQFITLIDCISLFVIFIEIVYAKITIISWFVPAIERKVNDD